MRLVMMNTIDNKQEQHDALMERVLSARIKYSDVGDNITIGEYLQKLLSTFFDKEYLFNGKHPFGNSFWEHKIYDALVLNRVLEGEITMYEDREFRVVDYDKDKANQLINDAINYVFRKWSKEIIATPNEYIEFIIKNIDNKMQEMDREIFGNHLIANQFTKEQNGMSQ